MRRSNPVASFVVILTAGESAGLPLLGECLCCWPVLEASPSATARRLGDLDGGLLRAVVAA